MNLKQKIQKSVNLKPHLKQKLLAVFEKLSKKDKLKLIKAFLNEELYAARCQKCVRDIDKLYDKYKNIICTKIEKDSLSDTAQVLSKLNDL